MFLVNLWIFSYFLVIHAERGRGLDHHKKLRTIGMKPVGGTRLTPNVRKSGRRFVEGGTSRKGFGPRQAQENKEDCDRERDNFHPLFVGSKYLYEYLDGSDPNVFFCQQITFTKFDDYVNRCKRVGLELVEITSFSDLQSILQHPEVFGNNYWPLALKQDKKRIGVLKHLDGTKNDFLYTNPEFLGDRGPGEECIVMSTLSNPKEQQHWNDYPCSFFPGDGFNWGRGCALCQFRKGSVCYETSEEELNREGDGLVHVTTLGQLQILLSLTQETYKGAEEVCRQAGGGILSADDGAGAIIRQLFYNNRVSNTTLMWLKQSPVNIDKDQCRGYAFLELPDGSVIARGHYDPFSCTLTPLFVFCTVKMPAASEYPEEVCVDTLDEDVRPDPCDCEKYVRCIRGRYIERGCPRGLHFDPNTKQCDLPETVPCKPMDANVDPAKCPCILGDYPMEGVLCSPMHYLQHRDRITGGCHRKSMKCADGLIWHPLGVDETTGGARGVCDFPRNVEGCNNAGVAAKVEKDKKSLNNIQQATTTEPPRQYNPYPIPLVKHALHPRKHRGYIRHPSSLALDVPK